MTTMVLAVFENGVFRPLAPLALQEGQQVQLVIAADEAAKTEILSRPMESVGDLSSVGEDLSEEDFEACLDSLAEGLDLPLLPATAYDRESIYGDG